jgi:hypothetical protein
MINYVGLLNKKVKVITMVLFNSGRKIKTDYVGTLLEDRHQVIIIKELDGTKVSIHKKHIKRVEEYDGN